MAGNLTQGPDDRWTALDARHLYRHAKTAGYLYQAALRTELTERLGVSWKPVEHGVADINGVTREVIEHFSQRRAEILEHMAQHGGRSAHSAQVAALEARRAKDEPGADRLRELWRARAAEHGLDPTTVSRLATHDRAVPLPTGIDEQQLTEQASTFGRAELLQELAQAQPRGARAGELEQIADTMLAGREVFRVEDRAGPGGATERRYSTRELLDIEADLIARADRSDDANVAVASQAALSAALADRSLSQEQHEMVWDLTRRGDRITVVRAPAGAGKTFALDAAREAWETDGTQVIGCALSARAALELEDQAAISSSTIAKLTYDLQSGHELPHGSVLVIDEAGMVGTRAIAQLAEAAERAEAKLVLVGDDRQLPEIQAGGAFHALASRPEAIALTEVRRQEQAWDRDALTALRDGEVERWARAYRDHGQITVAPSAQEVRAALVNDWSRADGDRLMIAARRADVRDLNQRARELLQANGTLGPDELIAAGRGFAVGDRVIGCRNDRHLGILNGQRGTVRAIDREHRSLQVALDTGTTAELGDDYLRAGHLDHGYAITAHRAQGATVDRSFVLGSEELHREWGYTALTRHRQQARFSIAAPELGDTPDLPDHADAQLDAINALLFRTHIKTMAIDQLSQADRADLERERDALRRQFQADPIPERRIGDEAANTYDLDRWTAQAAARLRGAERDRDQTPWHRRSDRAARDNRVARAIEDHHRLRERQANHLAGIDHADLLDGAWIDNHLDQALRYAALADELRRRDRLDDDAAGHVEPRLTRAPDGPGLDRPHHATPFLDDHLDMGL